MWRPRSCLTARVNHRRVMPSTTLTRSLPPVKIGRSPVAAMRVAAVVRASSSSAV